MNEELRDEKASCTQQYLTKSLCNVLLNDCHAYFSDIISQRGTELYPALSRTGATVLSATKLRLLQVQFKASESPQTLDAHWRVCLVCDAGFEACGLKFNKSNLFYCKDEFAQLRVSMICRQKPVGVRICLGGAQLRQPGMQGLGSLRSGLKQWRDVSQQPRAVAPAEDGHRPLSISPHASLQPRTMTH